VEAGRSHDPDGPYLAAPRRNTDLRIASGPHGNIWVTQSDEIGRITPAGSVKPFKIPTLKGEANEIAPGLGGDMWFTETSDKLGRITPSGVITEFRSRRAAAARTASPGGAMVITEFPIPTPNGEALGIAKGPDGNIWFVEANTDKVGRVSVRRSLGRRPRRGSLRAGTRRPSHRQSTHHLRCRARVRCRRRGAPQSTLLISSSNVLTWSTMIVRASSGRCSAIASSSSPCSCTRAARSGSRSSTRCQIRSDRLK